MRFSVNRGCQLGLTARGTHYVLPLSDCPIAHEYINRALAVLSRHVNTRPQLLIRCGAASGQVLIQPEPATEVAQELEAAGLDLRSETMEEFLAGETFRIRPSSFFRPIPRRRRRWRAWSWMGFWRPVSSRKTGG